MPGVFALVGVVLLILAGLNAGAPRFNPGWLGLGFMALAVAWGSITAIGG